jgi:hypothetical protein
MEEKEVFYNIYEGPNSRGRMRGLYKDHTNECIVCGSETEERDRTFEYRYECVNDDCRTRVTYLEEDDGEDSLEVLAYEERFEEYLAGKDFHKVNRA